MWFRRSQRAALHDLTAPHDCKRDIYLGLSLMEGSDLPTRLFGVPIEITPQCATFGKHLAIRPGPARRRWSWSWSWQRIGYLTCVRCGMRWGPMPAVLMGEPYTLAPCQTCGQLVYHGPTTPVPEHVICWFCSHPASVIQPTCHLVVASEREP